MSGSSSNSLKHAIYPNSTTCSITSSSLTTISTSNEAKAANGSTSENLRLVMAIFLNVVLNSFLFVSLDR
ncbi:hypothetical protein AAC387_Pa08g0241 [Persea americana]